MQLQKNLKPPHSRDRIQWPKSPPLDFDVLQLLSFLCVTPYFLFLGSIDVIKKALFGQNIERHPHDDRQKESRNRHAWTTKKTPLSYVETPGTAWVKRWQPSQDYCAHVRKTFLTEPKYYVILPRVCLTVRGRHWRIRDHYVKKLPFTNAMSSKCRRFSELSRVSYNMFYERHDLAKRREVWQAKSVQVVALNWERRKIETLGRRAYRLLEQKKHNAPGHSHPLLKGTCSLHGVLGNLSSERRNRTTQIATRRHRKTSIDSTLSEHVILGKVGRSRQRKMEGRKEPGPSVGAVQGNCSRRWIMLNHAEPTPGDRRILRRPRRGEPECTLPVQCLF